LTPISKLGLFFFEPTEFEQGGERRQSFTGEMKWVEVAADAGRFEGFLTEVLALLSRDKPPVCDPGCPWCEYRRRMTGKDAGADRDPAAPTESCPVCDGPMRLRNGRYGEFWSCMQYPQCRGTRNAART